MGLGIDVSSPLPKQGWFGRTIGRDALFGKIRSAVESYLTDPLLRRLVSFGTYEHTLSVALHPVATMEFVWAPTGMKATLKTSGAGPGLHAFACDLLQEVEHTCGLLWNWADGDEAGYALDRDYPSLQQQMANFLKSLAGEILRLAEDRAANLTLNWPIDAPRPNSQAFSVSPFGTWSREWWEAVVGSDEHSLQSHAETFYPWWHRELDASFWRNTGLVLLWSDVPWHAPANEDEHRSCRLALDCFDRARTIDPSVALPSTEIEELSALVSADKQEPPRQTGIGFRRYLMEFRLTDSWSIVLPGYFHQGIENEQETLVFWFGSRTVRATTVTAGGDKPLTPDDLVPDAAEAGDLLFRPLKHLKGRAKIELTSENDHKYWMLSGCMAAHNAMCIASVCYDDPADEDWAIRTFKSISHPPPQTT